MKLHMLSVARDELFEAIRYYNNQREGLGFEFANEIKESLLRIIRYPDAWPKVSKRSRTCLLKRFPFAILYRRIFIFYLLFILDSDYWLL